MEKIECKHCGRKFDNNASLKQHQNDKHSGEMISTIASVQSKPKIKLKTMHFIVIGTVILIVAIAGYVLQVTGYFSLSPKTSYTPLLPHIENFKGSENASVTIIEYSDFQCPFCGRVQPTIEQVMSTYQGKVKLIYRHFPLTNIHPFSFKAAEAGECAADQGKFWEYHDKLFQNQNSLTISDLKRYATETGLNSGLFNACLDSSVMKQYVQRDFEEGNRNGVTGTPAFLINGQLIFGAQPFSVFQSAIDRALGS